MATKTERMNCPSDDGDCIRCGECCMVLDLATITDDERERLGKEFCIKYLGKHGIKKVPRTWAPDFATDGVCVFLFPREGGGFTCMAREERPLMCSEFRCTSEHWAPLMDYKVAELKVHAEKETLNESQMADRLVELTALHAKAGL